MVDLNRDRPRPGSPEAGLLADMRAANPDNRAGLEREAAEVVARLSSRQLRILRAMPARGAKKWRALYRHAKLAVRGPDFVQLPFRLARPTLRGSEELTALGRIAKGMVR